MQKTSFTKWEENCSDDRGGLSAKEETIISLPGGHNPLVHEIYGRRRHTLKNRTTKDWVQPPLRFR